MIDAWIDAWNALGWVDHALLGVLALSMLVGLWRGLAFEFVSLLGWLCAYGIANGAAPVLAPWLAYVLPWGAPESTLHLWAAYALVFVLVLLLCGVLARMLRALIAASPLSLLDRLLGAVFGALRALVLLLFVATLLALTPLGQARAWRDSHGSVWLAQALGVLKPVLPEDLTQELTRRIAF